MGSAANGEMLEGCWGHHFWAQAGRSRCVICHVLSPASTRVEACTGPTGLGPAVRIVTPQPTCDKHVGARGTDAPLLLQVLTLLSTPAWPILPLPSPPQMALRGF